MIVRTKLFDDDLSANDPSEYNICIGHNIDMTFRTKYEQIISESTLIVTKICQMISLRDFPTRFLPPTRDLPQEVGISYVGVFSNVGMP